MLYVYVSRMSINETNTMEYNGLDLPTISLLEKQGRDRYDQIIPILKELKKPTAFNTKRYQINIGTKQQ